VIGVARGWESKSVEGQIESADTERGSSGRESVTPEQAELRRKREDLLLARVRVLQQLQQSLNLRYQQMLKMALKDLDEKLARLT
jgi:hypothetical protein